MCINDPQSRISSFETIKRQLIQNEIPEDLFTKEEIGIYQNFANELSKIISSIYEDTKYYDDIEFIQKELSDLYRKVMLENFLPQNTTIIKCFLDGAYRYKTNVGFNTAKLNHFLKFIKSCSKEKKNIVLSNLHSRFDGIRRIEPELLNDAEIPF